MKKFNLNEALDGKPVQLRDGRRAFVKAIIKQPKGLEHYTVIGHAPNGIHEEFLHWATNGNIIPDDMSDDDIVGMWEEPKRYINGIEVQRPLTMKTCVNGEKYWFVDLQSSELVTEMPLYYFNTESLNLVDRGLAFRRKQDAKAMAKALLNYKVEVKNE
ncbi:hypothetical protein ACLQ91_01860 [Avibacterium endocarditidis]|uniref:hypothetical protein n=1 Tax=Avibacterium endocarditidis TaxID=380674 RepID=UPI0039FD30C3